MITSWHVKVMIPFIGVCFYFNPGLVIALPRRKDGFDQGHGKAGVSDPAEDRSVCDSNAPASCYKKRVLEDPVSENLAQGLGPRSLFSTGEGTPVSWAYGSNSFKLILQESNCLKVTRETVLGDYTFTNGSQMHDVNSNDVLIDEFNLRHGNANANKASMDHVLVNAHDAQSELADYFDTLQAHHGISSIAHTELRHLLLNPMQIAFESLRQKVLWTAYLTPALGAGSLMGYALAREVAPLTLNKTMTIEDEVVTTLLVAGAVFLGFIILRLQDQSWRLITGTEPPGLLSARERHAFIAYCAWFRRLIRQCWEALQAFDPADVTRGAAALGRIFMNYSGIGGDFGPGVGIEMGAMPVVPPQGSFGPAFDSVATQQRLDTLAASNLEIQPC